MRELHRCSFSFFFYLGKRFQYLPPCRFGAALGSRGPPLHFAGGKKGGHGFPQKPPHLCRRTSLLNHAPLHFRGLIFKAAFLNENPYMAICPLRASEGGGGRPSRIACLKKTSRACRWRETRWPPRSRKGKNKPPGLPSKHTRPFAPAELALFHRCARFGATASLEVERMAPREKHRS